MPTGTRLLPRPRWHILTAENADLAGAGPVALPDKMSVAAQRRRRLPRPIPEGPFHIIGKPAPRLHGFGHVTGFGQYSEHMTQPGMVFMKTLGSPHPHARIKRVDTTKAEAFPGVVSILHRGNLPDLYKDVSIGSAHQTASSSPRRSSRLARQLPSLRRVRSHRRRSAAHDHRRLRGVASRSSITSRA